MNACHEDLTLWLDEDSDELIILDQTKLPGKEETVSISTARALYDAIRTLQVRGAPAIGVAAALGLYACAVRFEDETPEGFLYSLRKTKAFIASARPTAQNLFWALIYNCIMIPLAAVGILAPALAGAAMALSSVSVVSNSLLLKRFK